MTWKLSDKNPGIKKNNNLIKTVAKIYIKNNAAIKHCNLLDESVKTENTSKVKN